MLQAFGLVGVSGCRAFYNLISVMPGKHLKWILSTTQLDLLMHTELSVVAYYF